MSWAGQQPAEPIDFTCGHCGLTVGTNQGFFQLTKGNRGGKIYLCPRCDKPTFFDGDFQVPGVAFGRNVSHLPDEVASLYREARNCMMVNAFTSSVLGCRKLLMNISVANGAKEGLRFVEYVDFLDREGYLPKKGKDTWVKKIKDKGNEATHQIKMMGKNDAEEILTFTEMLLQIVFEFPAKGN